MLARADKLIKLFRAKAQLFERHWHPRWVGFGVAMLKLWVLTRTAGCWVMGQLVWGGQSSYETWREVWRRRAEYVVVPKTHASPVRAIDVNQIS